MEENQGYKAFAKRLAEEIEARTGYEFKFGINGGLIFSDGQMEYVIDGKDLYKSYKESWDFEEMIKTVSSALLYDIPEQTGAFGRRKIKQDPWNRYWGENGQNEKTGMGENNCFGGSFNGLCENHNDQMTPAGYDREYDDYDNYDNRDVYDGYYDNNYDNYDNYDDCDEENAKDFDKERYEGYADYDSCDDDGECADEFFVPAANRWKVLSRELVPMLVGKNFIEKRGIPGMIVASLCGDCGVVYRLKKDAVLGGYEDMLMDEYFLNDMAGEMPEMEEVHAQAVKNMRHIYGYQLEKVKGENGVYRFQAIDGSEFGATLVLDPSFMQRVANMMETNKFFVILANPHEGLLVSDKSNIPEFVLRQTLDACNQSQNLEDCITENLYLYDSNEGILKIVI